MKANLYLFIFGLMICYGMLCPCPSFAQSPVVWKGVVRDGVTKKTLPDVRIYADKDTVGIKSNGTGEFQVTAKQGSKVYFRKQGYTWQSVSMPGHRIEPVELLPSSPDNVSKHVKGDRKIEEIYVNGKPLPKVEWNDINPEDITDVGVKFLTEETARILIFTR